MSAKDLIVGDAVVVVSEEQVSADLSGEAAILNLQSGIYYGLNKVGAFIWEQIQQPVTVDQVCEAVCAAFDVSLEQCQTDVSTLLRGLADENLIEIRDASQA